MPGRLKDAKLEAVATEYLTNGFNKVMALIAAGYSRTYSEHGGLKLFDDIRLKDKVTALQAKIAAKTVYTLETIQAGHERLMAISLQRGDNSAAFQNWQAIGKTVGAYQENLNVSPAVVKHFTPEEERLLRCQAELLLQPTERGCGLHSGTGQL